MDIASLQAEVATLQAQLATAEQRITQGQEEVKEVRQENAVLRQKLDALIRRYFGKKSEQLDNAQLELLLSGLEESEETLAAANLSTTTATTKRKPQKQTQRVRTPDNLEVVRDVIQPPEVQADPQQWKEIGQEVSRQLDYQPGKFFWLETVRVKYVHAEKRELPPVIAPAPERACGLAAPGLLAHLLVSKFSDHLPFYRQQSIFLERHDVFIARQQMVMWMKQGTTLLEGITRCIKEEFQKSSYAQVDETPIKYLDPGKGQCSQGYLWTGHVPGQCVLYEWHPSRSAECLNSLLGEGFKGKVQCDGYSAYPAFAKDRTEVLLFGCWAHARRLVFEAQE